MRHQADARELADKQALESPLTHQCQQLKRHRDSAARLFEQVAQAGGQVLVLEGCREKQSFVLFMQGGVSGWILHARASKCLQGSAGCGGSVQRVLPALAHQAKG